MPWEVSKIDDPRMRENQLPDDTFIARYMDVPEFLGILNRRIKFTSLFKLREHDAFEFNLDPSELKVDRQKLVFHTPNADEIEEMLQDKDWSRYWYALCWCSDQVESMALWKIFASMGKGVRIESDVGSLLKSIRKDYWPVDVFAHTVEYNKDNQSKSIYEAIYRKRHEFRYEAEVRFATQVMYHHGKNHFLVPILPEVMLKRIVVGPQISWAYADIVAAVKAARLSTEIVSQSAYVDDAS